MLKGVKQCHLESAEPFKVLKMKSNQVTSKSHPIASQSAFELKSESEARAARENSQREETLRRFQGNTKDEAEEIERKVESEGPENTLQFSLKTYRKY